MPSTNSDPGRMPSARLSVVSSSGSASDVAGNDVSSHAEASIRSDGSIDREDERFQSDLAKANGHISRAEQIYAGLLDNGESAVSDESIRTDESVGSDDDLAKVNEQLSRAELYYNGHLAP